MPAWKICLQSYRWYSTKNYRMVRWLGHLRLLSISVMKGFASGRLRSRYSCQPNTSWSPYRLLQLDTGLPSQIRPVDYRPNKPSLQFCRWYKKIPMQNKVQPSSPSDPGKRRIIGKIEQFYTYKRRYNKNTKPGRPLTCPFTSHITSVSRLHHSIINIAQHSIASYRT